MADRGWKDRLGVSRDAAQAGVDALSASARDAVATARSRVGTTYGAARGRADALAATGRGLALSGLAAGTRAAGRSRLAVDRAGFSARALVAERPLTIVVAGVAAGIVLGYLANRLAQSRAEPVTPVEDDEIYD